MRPAYGRVINVVKPQQWLILHGANSQFLKMFRDVEEWRLLGCNALWLL
jgi:hypothetical protein